MIHLSLKEIIKFTLLISSEVSTSEFFCADFGSSEQSSCGAAKNSPQDCFLNAATVFKKIIVYLLLSTPKSVMALGIYLYAAVYISA